MIELVETNEENWRKILNHNAKLKAKAQPWPELIEYLTFDKSTGSLTGAGHEDYASPLRLEGDDVIVSFSGGMGALTFAIDRSMSQSGHVSKSKSLTGSSSDSIGGSASVAGFGIGVNLLGSQ